MLEYLNSMLLARSSAAGDFFGKDKLNYENPFGFCNVSNDKKRVMGGNIERLADTILKRHYTETIWFAPTDTILKRH